MECPYFDNKFPILYCRSASFSGTDPNAFFKRGDKYLAVANIAFYPIGSSC
jgi:hypothetical protein